MSKLPQCGEGMSQWQTRDKVGTVCGRSLEQVESLGTIVIGMYILNKVILGENWYKFKVGQPAGRNAPEEWCGRHRDVLSRSLFNENLVTCLHRASSVKVTSLLWPTSSDLLVWGSELPNEPSYDMGLENTKGCFAWDSKGGWGGCTVPAQSCGSELFRAMEESMYRRPL